MTAPLVFVDTETTGVHPERRAWEVALIRVDAAGRRGCSFFIGDVDLSRADLRGLQVGGFYERHPLYNGQHTPRTPLNDGEKGWYSAHPFGGHGDYVIVSEAQAARRIEQWTRGAHLVGAVPSFDAEVFATMLRHHRLVPAWHYHLIDVEALAVGALAARGTPVTLPWSSDEISRALGVEPPTDARHTAMGDARWAQQLYAAATGERP